MNVRDHYLDGVPCRIDLDGEDLEGAADLYAELLGWTIQPAARITAGASPGTSSPGAPTPAAGRPAPTSAAERSVPKERVATYEQRRLAARLDGAYVAGFGLPDADITSRDGRTEASPASAAAEERGARRPARWCTSVAVTDIDAALRRVEAHGGTTSVEPRRVGEEGRWASLLDPAGAELGLWEARDVLGAERVNEPGTWNWSDLTTDRPEEVRAFYGGVFGWDAREFSFEGEIAWLWCLPGYGDDLERQDPGIRERHADASAPPGFTDAVGWMARLDDAPAVDAPAWTVTFAVGDVDHIVRRARELRVAVELPPMTADEVRFAILRDPWGASFTVSQYLGPS